MTYYYTWFRDEIQISGALTNSYVVASDDVGHILNAHVLAYAGCAGSGNADSNKVQIPDVGDEPGLAEPDQAASSSDAGLSSPATAIPMSPTGPAPSGSYTTELWSGAETGTTDGVYVVSSTATGTAAVTGVVVDINTGDPLSGATVSLTAASTTTTTSNASGAFAFIDMPMNTYELNVSAVGYGLYRVLNASLEADSTYQVTANADVTPQTFDELGTAQDNPATAGVAGTAYSWTRVPPSIMVGVFPLYPPNTYDAQGTPLNCSRSSDTYHVVNYPFDYYVLRVAKQEVSIVQYNQVGQQAFFALVQNYAWYHKTLPGAFDVENSTNHQCFRPERFVPRAWHVWLQDVLDERLVSSSGGLLETLYLAGHNPPICPDSTVPSGISSQWSIKGLSSGTGSGCSFMTNWRGIDTYFYGGSRVTTGFAPPIPKASATVSGGSITFNYSSKVYGANVAWKFAVDMKLADGTWKPLGVTRWSWTTRSIKSSFVYTPADSTCRRYRVRAGNPVNWSLPGQVTAPGVGLSPSGTCTL